MGLYCTTDESTLKSSKCNNEGGAMGCLCPNNQAIEDIRSRLEEFSQRWDCIVQQMEAHSKAVSVIIRRGTCPLVGDSSSGNDTKWWRCRICG